MCRTRRKWVCTIEPGKLIPALLEGAELKLAQTFTLDDLRDDVPTVLAAGEKIISLLPWLKIEGRLGQVELAEVGVEAPASAIASGHYALALGKKRLWGATFEAWDGRVPEPSDAAREQNMAALETLDPYWRQSVKAAPLTSRAGVRATTADRLPLIGAVPDEVRAREVFDGVRHGKTVEADAPLIDGLYLAGGYGARGFTWAPWAGEVLTVRWGAVRGGPASSPRSGIAVR